MPQFKVIKTFCYTKELTVEADSRNEAETKGLASNLCDYQGGDHLIGCDVVELNGEAAAEDLKVSAFA